VRYLHYCCRHSVGPILKSGGVLKPNTSPGFQPKVVARAKELGMDEALCYAYPVVWVTDVDVRTHSDAMKIGLGQLEGNLTDCFRVEFRFIVPNVGLMTWEQYKAAQPDEAPPGYRDLLEDAAGADPSRWWVSTRPVTGCRLDQTYHATPEKDFWAKTAADIRRRG
jgi:hypothetical protein